MSLIYNLARSWFGSVVKTCRTYRSALVLLATVFVHHSQVQKRIDRRARLLATLFVKVQCFLFFTYQVQAIRQPETDFRVIGVSGIRRFVGFNSRQTIYLRLRP